MKVRQKMGGVLKFKRNSPTFLGGRTFGRPLAWSELGAACLLRARKQEELGTRNAAAHMRVMTIMTESNEWETARNTDSSLAHGAHG